MKRIVVLVLVMIFVLSLTTGCVGDTNTITDTNDAQQAQQQAQILRDQNNQVGLPDIKEWTEKKMAKLIYELRDNSKLICYAYTKNEMDGKYVYEGRCMGFGLPYATQYSNPEKLGTVDGGQYNAQNPYTLPQAEPNGLFMPSSANATWLIMINEDTGKTEVQYYEPNIVVTQTKKPARLCEAWSLSAGY